MAEKACRKCKTVFSSGNKCPNCGSEEFSDSFKGKMEVINPEQSEIAKSAKITKKGVYAIKLG